LKILIANYEFPPIGGGASKVSFELARTLVKLGHEVTVLTSRYGDAPSIETVDGIIVHRVWSWRIGVHDSGVRGAFTYLLSALPRLRKILNSERIDVVHYFFGLPTGFLSLYSHSIKTIPYIISLRGSDVPLYDRDSRMLRFLHRLTRPLSHKVWRNASQVFAVSRGLGELANVSFPDVEVGVIYNGINFIKDPKASRMDNCESLIRLVCVSRLIPRKGISDLLDALASLPEIDFELSLIGEGPSEKALKKLADAHGIADKVNFIGYCTPQEVQRHNLESDIFVLPTHSDAFANVILEAMSAALPVIACAVGGVAEAVVDGKTGILVNPGNSNHLSTAIKTLANDEELRTKLGLAGQQRARSLFTWDENARRYAEAYADAVNTISSLQRRDV
jgi:glycogen(starch) synthase